MHGLYYFLQEHKLFRHNVLQLHILYPWLPNGDAFPTHSLNETLIDGTFQMLTVPSHMLWIGYVYATNLVYHLLFLFFADLWWYQLLLLLPWSISGTRTFTVSPTFPCGNFSLASPVILNACVSKLLFTAFLFSVILF